LPKTANAQTSAVLSELSYLTVIRLEAMVFIPLPLYLIAKILKYLSFFGKHTRKKHACKTHDITQHE
jgi:hypothetical protein